MVKHRRPWRLIRYARRIVYLCFDLFGELQSVQNVRHLAWRVQRPSRPARWAVVRRARVQAARQAKQSLIKNLV